MRSPFDKHKRFITESGSRDEYVYQVKYEKGVKMLVRSGKVNRYDEIQSHRESCDINVILKRYMNGDSSVLSRNNPLYIDTTVMPESYAEWFDVIQRASDYFYSLPADVRSQFNNSVEQFVVNISTSGFDNYPSVVGDSVDKVPVESGDKEAVKDES